MHPFFLADFYAVLFLRQKVLVLHAGDFALPVPKLLRGFPLVVSNFSTEY